MEFKEVLNSPNPNFNRSIQKAVCSFANTNGGFIVFGIKDKGAVSGWDRLCGLENTDNFSKELTNKLSGGKVIPHVVFEGPKIVCLNHNGNALNIAVIKVPNSELKPHAIVTDKDGLLEFWMRGNASAAAATYPYLTKTIEESSQLKNILAALYLDTQYVDTFADKMHIEEYRRRVDSPTVKINSLVTSEQSAQIIASIPTDIALVSLIWQLREKVEQINYYADLMTNLRLAPLVNADLLRERYNNNLGDLIPSTKEINKKIRAHLLGEYAGVREWMNVVQQV